MTTSISSKVSSISIMLSLTILFGSCSDKKRYEGEMVNVDGNELYYSPNVPEEDLNKLISQFQTNDFFGVQYGNIALLELKDDVYYITMVVDEKHWNDEKTISNLNRMKWLLEVQFGRPTGLRLESPTRSGEYRHLKD